MRPGTPSVGGFLPIQAAAQAPAFLSMHIGSGPGVVGLSGMQVQPLWPSRSVFIDPSACAATIVASLETERGAAAIALSIGSRGRAAALALALSPALPCEGGAAPSGLQPASVAAAQAPSRSVKWPLCMTASS